jgi:hypothetical protein
MYVRNKELQECWEKNAWYGVQDLSDISENLLYNPDDEAMETLAALKPEWFVYDKPFLLDRNRSVLYGFSVTGSADLEIPESVRIYDNLFIHEEDKGCKNIWINEKLDTIVNVQNAFGFYVENYYTDERNSKFAAEDGVLYNSLPEEDENVKLILFPSGRGKSMQDSYFQFCSGCDVEIGEYAFYMDGFIRALVLPPYAKINENSFFIRNGRGKLFACSEQHKDLLLSCIRSGQISGVSIEFYEMG